MDDLQPLVDYLKIHYPECFDAFGKLNKLGIYALLFMYMTVYQKVIKCFKEYNEKEKLND